MLIVDMMASLLLIPPLFRLAQVNDQMSSAHTRALRYHVTTLSDNEDIKDRIDQLVTSIELEERQVRLLGVPVTGANLAATATLIATA